MPADSSTFSAVLDEYERSPNFTTKSPGTQRQYARYLRWAHATMGFVPVIDMEPAILQAALDGLADRPGAQFNARALMSAVDKWAIVRKKLPRQIVPGTEIIGSDGGHDPWTDEHVRLGETRARPDIGRIVTLGVNTGQRGSDMVRMRYSDIAEQQHPFTGEMHPGIHVMQQKTGVRLWVPFTAALTARIEEWRAENRRRAVPSIYLVTKPDGEPYTRPQLSERWGHERETNPALASLAEAGLTIHGLRATCVVRLRKAGASVLQICSMIGMSEPMVSRYSRFADQTDMALAAVHHLDARTIAEHKRRNEQK